MLQHPRLRWLGLYFGLKCNSHRTVCAGGQRELPCVQQGRSEGHFHSGMNGRLSECVCCFWCSATNIQLSEYASFDKIEKNGELHSSFPSLGRSEPFPRVCSDHACTRGRYRSMTAITGATAVAAVARTFLKPTSCTCFYSLFGFPTIKYTL